MAKQQTVLWTVVPHGMTPDGTHLRASLVVSPRLATDVAPPRTLADWSDWLDWPAQLASATFRLAFANGPTVDATPVSAASSPVWTALFGAATPVTPYAVEPFTTRPIRSYPVGHVADFVAGLYADLYDLSPEEPPHPGRVVVPLAPFDPVGLRQIAVRLARILADPQQRAVPAGPADPAFDAAQAVFFHDHAIGAQQAPTELNGSHPASPAAARALLADPEPPKLDFHQALGLLASYPTLLRLFGLVVDVEVPAAGVPSAGGGLTVAGRVTWTPDGGVPTTNVTPPTAYVLDVAARRFAARSKLPAPEIVDGLLSLTPGPDQVHRIIQLDTDGAALKLNQTTTVLNKLATGNEPALADDVEDSGALPSLTSGGLAIVRAGRAFRLARTLDDISVLNLAVVTNPAAPETLYLEDLVAGWRMDVRDVDAARWHTLCARRGPWKILAGGGETLHEGALDDEGFLETGATADPESGAPDLYLHESLARWVGWSLVAPRPGEALLPDDTPGTAADAPGDDFRLKTDLAATPATLPRLRFGRAYRLRLRVVDIAGNGRPLGDPLSPDVTGASAAEHYWRFPPVPYPAVVPRSAPNQAIGESVERLVLRSNDGITAVDYAAANALPPSDERHIVPPRATVELVEQHGRLDGPGGPAKSAYALLTARDNGLDAVAGAEMAGPSGALLVIPAPTFALPYLPDPAGAGVCFRDLPGMAPGSALTIPFGGTWPDLTPVRLQLVEDLSAGPGASTPPQFDPSTQVLTVWLKKGLRARARVSTTLDGGIVDVFGQWQWLVAKKGGAPMALRQAAIDGRHWLLTPDRRIDLVHAVQQPLEAPSFTAGFGATRTTLGQRDATLAGAIGLHGPSTGQLNLRAAWTEPHDDPAKAAPETREGEAPAGTFKVPGDSSERDVAGAKVAFPDTKHRLVAFTAVGASRFRADFPPAIADDPAALSRLSEPKVVPVLSSARPAAPRIRHVLPTFRWEDGPTTRTRRTGLRVWIERPWYSSGDGELLAVILDDGELPIGQPGATPTPHDPDPAVAQYVTRWAEDPAWDAAWPGNLRTNRFGNAERTGNDLTIEELKRPDGTYPTAARVTAIGHTVHWDADRALWFADIDIAPDAGSYFPFIRLALARYQPDSLPHAHLSRVVLADFAQLAPERVVAIVPLGGNRFTVTVSGPRPTPSSTGQRIPAQHSLTAVLEQSPKSEAGDALRGWTSVQTLALAPGRGDDVSAEFLTRGDPNQDYRVVVSEIESFPGSDDIPAGGGPGATPSRLVYTAALAVPHEPIPTATPSPTATATGPGGTSQPTATWTLAPSRTPASTVTPRPPTATPTITLTPSATPTATPTITPGGPTLTPPPPTATPTTTSTPTDPPIFPSPTPTSPTPTATPPEPTPGGPSVTPGPTGGPGTPGTPTGSPAPRKRIFIPRADKRRP